MSMVALCIAASVALQTSEAPPAKQIRAVRLQGTSITLDGRLDDPVWSRASWISDFIQKRPREGARPGDSMRIAIFYDDDALVEPLEPEPLAELAARAGAGCGGGV